MRENDSSKVSGAGFLKKSVATVYDTDTFSAFLKDTIHPGGLPLTQRVVELASPDTGSIILDIACGRGVACLLLAEKYGCRVAGIDMSKNKIAAARESAKTRGVSRQTGFAVSDAEVLPFQDGVFDILISECSFSILPDKEKAVRGIRRVLRPGGRFLMTDVVRKADASGEKVDGLSSCSTFPLVPCIAGARPVEEYLRLFKQAGFQIDHVEDHSIEMKKLGYKMVLAFGGWEGFLERLSSDLQSSLDIRGKQDPVGCSLEAYRNIFKKIRLGYALIMMSKPRRAGVCGGKDIVS